MIYLFAFIFGLFSFFLTLMVLATVIEIWPLILVVSLYLIYRDMRKNRMIHPH